MTKCTQCGLASTGSGYSPLCLDCRVARTSAERAARKSRYNGKRKTPTRKRALIVQRVSPPEDALIVGLEGMLFRAAQEVVLARILDEGKRTFDVIEYQEMWSRGMHGDEELNSACSDRGVAESQLRACPYVAPSFVCECQWEFTGSGLMALRRVKLPARSG